MTIYARGSSTLTNTNSPLLRKEPLAGAFWRTAATTTTTRSFTAIQNPNRFTMTYNRMQEVCPESISEYAQCVQAIQMDPDRELVQHACQDAFERVKDCFRMARRELREEGKKE